LESTEGQSYLGFYFVLSQILLLALVYLFTKVDWRFLLEDRKLRWMQARITTKVGSPDTVATK